MSDILLWDQEDHVLTLTMNRPEERNALSSPEIFDAFEDAFRRISNDLSIRAVVLTGAGSVGDSDIPEDAVLIARNIGPGELLDYGRRLRGVVLEEGSVGSHAAIVARAWAYDTLGLSTLVSYIDPKNAPSRALAERLGARLDPGATPPEKGDLVYRHPTPQALR